MCNSKQLESGQHSIYILGVEAWYDSQMEMTYAGPDTDEVRTVLGSQPYEEKCDQGAGSGGAGFTLCTFTSTLRGDCMQTVGKAYSSPDVCPSDKRHTHSATLTVTAASSTSTQP